MNNQSAFELYLRDIRAFPLLTRKEEITLSKTILKSKDIDQIHKAKQKLAESNLRLVVYLAIKHYKTFGSVQKVVSPLDLIAEGNVGLMRATESYNYRKGSFASYASITIERKIRQAVEKARMVHIPSQHAGYWAQTKKLIEKYGKGITDELIASELHITNNLAGRIRQGLLNTSIVMLDGIENWQEFTKNDEDVGADLQRGSLKDYICSKIDHVLSPKESMIFKILIEHPCMSFCEIAKRVNVSAARVAQLHCSALRKLRNGIIKEWEKEHDIPNEERYLFSKSRSFTYSIDGEENGRQKIRKRIMKELLGET